MGCIVNAQAKRAKPITASPAAKGKGLLFKKGQVLGTYPYEELCDRLLDLINSDGTDGKA